MRDRGIRRHTKRLADAARRMLETALNQYRSSHPDHKDNRGRHLARKSADARIDITELSPTGHSGKVDPARLAIAHEEYDRGLAEIGYREPFEPR